MTLHDCNQVDTVQPLPETHFCIATRSYIDGKVDATIHIKASSVHDNQHISTCMKPQSSTSTTAITVKHVNMLACIIYFVTFTR